MLTNPTILEKELTSYFRALSRFIVYENPNDMKNLSAYMKPLSKNFYQVIITVIFFSLKKTAYCILQNIWLAKYFCEIFRNWWHD